MHLLLLLGLSYTCFLSTWNCYFSLHSDTIYDRLLWTLSFKLRRNFLSILLNLPTWNAWLHRESSVTLFMLLLILYNFCFCLLHFSVYCNRNYFSPFSLSIWHLKNTMSSDVANQGEIAYLLITTSNIFFQVSFGRGMWISSC